MEGMGRMWGRRGWGWKGRDPEEQPGGGTSGQDAAPGDRIHSGTAPGDTPVADIPWGVAVIMSEEALGRRRALRRQRRLAREQPGGLTAEQRDLIGILIAAHQRTFDSSFSQFAHYRVSRDPGG